MNDKARAVDTEHTLTVSHGDVGLRLDTWLHAQLPVYSRSRLQGLIKKGHVRMDGATVRPHTAVRDGAVVTITCPPAEPVALVPEDMALDILYEDRDIVVVNKPADLVVHPAVGNWTGTLVNALLSHCGDLAGVGGELRPGIVHRLDKDTSGVIVVAKHDAAVENLVNQFKSGSVQKQYSALVRGVPRPSCRRLETLIGRSRHDRKKMSAQPPRGRRAVSHYEVVETYGALAAHVEVRIETGRTHQIRVHMAHIGHPVLGDSLYGRNRSLADLGVPGRQLLHARRLAFAHPVSGEPLVFEAPLPQDMVAWMDKMRALSTI